MKTFNITTTSFIDVDIDNLKKLKLSNKSRDYILNGKYERNMPIYYKMFIKRLKLLSIKDLKQVLKINPETLELLV